MTYFSAKELALDFESAIASVKEALSTEGFGVLTEIDVQGTLKTKLDVDIKKYRILGACNPPFAHKAIQAEPHIGLMLPCNVVVQEAGDGKTLVSFVDPVASMQAVENDAILGIAREVRDKLTNCFNRL